MNDLRDLVDGLSRNVRRDGMPGALPARAGRVVGSERAVPHPSVNLAQSGRAVVQSGNATEP